VAIEHFITYGFIYRMIRDKGPISMPGIAKILESDYGISAEEFRLSTHCKVGGILSCLSQHELIRCVPYGDSSHYKMWSISPFLASAPPSPRDFNAPKVKIPDGAMEDCAIKSLLSHVEHVRHMWCHMQIGNNIHAVTCDTCENPHIAHARARSYFFSSNVVSFLRNIWIIIKNACDTCDRR
jgi:hypothetical protein